MNFRHIPVLGAEALHYLIPEDGGRFFVDGTLGGGGHARMLLEKLPDAKLLGIDRDESAIEAARENLREFGDRVVIRRGVFSEIEQNIQEIGWGRVDGVLLDIGVSSHQIDEASRGFSFRNDAPLDMRMDRRSSVTAATILNSSDETELARIFYEYGEIRSSRRLAAELVRRRSERPWSRTGELAETVNKILGSGRRSLPSPTLVFQALRIAVNNELGELEKVLPTCLNLLRPKGRLVVISFHSLEDRIVKNFMRHEALSCVCPIEIVNCNCNKVATLRQLTRKPISAGREEIAKNPRSACARLRAAEILNFSRS